MWSPKRFFLSQRSPDGAPGFLPAQHFALPMDRFQQLGGFNESFAAAAGEDRDFCIRWRHSSGTLARIPEAGFTHCHPLSLRAFLRKHAE